MRVFDPYHARPKINIGPLPLGMKYTRKKIRTELLVLVDELLYMEDIQFQHITPYIVNKIASIKARISEIHKGLNARSY